MKRVGSEVKGCHIIMLYFLPRLHFHIFSLFSGSFFFVFSRPLTPYRQPHGTNFFSWFLFWSFKAAAKCEAKALPLTFSFLCLSFFLAFHGWKKRVEKFVVVAVDRSTLARTHIFCARLFFSGHICWKFHSMLAFLQLCNLTRFTVVRVPSPVFYFISSRS